MLKNIVLLMAIILLLGCSQEQSDRPIIQSAPTATPSASETKTTQSNPVVAEHLLVFFINPDGGPCRMQGDILSQMSNEFKGKVLVRPVQTTIKADMNIFSVYGIRALPTLLLADSSGKEIKRLPPGVHAAETIRELLKQIPGD
ncbi:MAG: thioredoxin family protein [Desulfuromusa sp.]|nr:thioredoxin family protein [Desulfuromusa sp.]